MFAVFKKQCKLDTDRYDDVTFSVKAADLNDQCTTTAQKLRPQTGSRNHKHGM